MTAARRPEDEERRLTALRETGVLDTPPEQTFDDLTRLAAAICGVPLAFVSLIDHDRQWFKSRVGFEAAETSRDVAFCAHTILADEVLVVPDATLDARFADNPSVTGGLRLRFYAGAPITLGSGERVGTVCVADSAARTASPAQIEALRSLARMAATNLDLRRTTRALALAHDERQAAYDQVLGVLDEIHDLIQSVGPDGSFLYTNRAWRETLGYSQADIDALRLFEIVAPESQAHFGELFRRVLASSEGGRIDAVLLAKDGRHVAVEGWASAGIADEHPAWVKTVLRDVSDKKSAQREKQQFLETTSNEMRAPLTAVRGALAMMAEEALPAQARELHGVAVTNTDRLLRIMRDVRDLEELEAGSFAIQRKGLDATEIVREAIVAAEKLARDRSVTVAMEVPRSLGVLGDRASVLQAMSSLLSNAIRRSPPGREVRVSVTSGEGALRFSFADEGERISQDAIADMFEAPSRRITGAPVTGSATALALAVCKAIVAAHGGAVGVTPVPRGAVFWFQLPA